jgi:hypothetical protein
MRENRHIRRREPHFTTLEFYRLMDTYLRAGEDMAGRPWRLAADGMRRSARRVLQGLLGPWSAGQIAAGLAEEYANLIYGLMTAGPIAIEGITTRLNNPPPGLLSEYRIPIAGADPQEYGTIFQVGAGGAVPFIIPARVVDASQGWAAWYVPIEKIASSMAAGAATGRIDEAALAAYEPVNCGHGRGMVVLLGVDYRVSDFGRYREIALALCLTPKGAVAEPGALFARLLVSDPFSLEPARRIWGFHKDCFEGLRVQYGETDARFCTGHGVVTDFSLTLPRFGTSRSFDVPVVIYSVRQPDPADAIAGPVRTILDRNGSGEGMQIGGRVRLHLGRRSGHAGQHTGAGTCFCSKADVPCLCDELRGLGIGQTPPAANGWTERMTGRLEAPGQLGLQPFGNH